MSRDQPLLDERRIHQEAQTGLIILELHLGFTLHGQYPLEESRAKTSLLRLLHSGSAELATEKAIASHKRDRGTVEPSGLALMPDPAHEEPCYITTGVVEMLEECIRGGQGPFGDHV